MWCGTEDASHDYSLPPSFSGSLIGLAVENFIFLPPLQLASTMEAFLAGGIRQDLFQISQKGLNVAPPSSYLVLLVGGHVAEAGSIGVNIIDM